MLGRVMACSMPKHFAESLYPKAFDVIRASIGHRVVCRTVADHRRRGWMFHVSLPGALRTLLRPGTQKRVVSTRRQASAIREHSVALFEAGNLEPEPVDTVAAAKVERTPAYPTNIKDLLSNGGFLMGEATRRERLEN